MPYFDERTYKIGGLIRDEDTLLRFAKEFFYICHCSGKYPLEILNAEQEALNKNNRNEIIIMADATTGYALNMEKAYDREFLKAASRQEQYELICITLAAVYTFRFGDYRHGQTTSLKTKILHHKKRYDIQYGKEDLSFVEPFIEERTQEMLEEFNRYQALTNERLIEKEKKRKEEEKDREQQKEQRKKEREAEIKQKRAQQKELQIQRNKERQIAIEQFRQKPLSKQLQTIVSNKKIPAYYGIDYNYISDSDLRAVPKAILVEVITSYMTVKDPDWKSLQRKAKRILAE